MTKNILHIDHEKIWRGGQNQTFELITQLKNYQSFLASPADSVLAKKLQNICLNAPMDIRNDLDFLAGIKLKKIIEHNQIAIAHAHTSKAHAALLWACMLGARVKTVVHRRVLPDTKKKISTTLKYQSSKIDCYICVSHAVGRGLEIIGVPQHKIHVIPSGVNGQNYLPLDKIHAREILQTQYGFDRSKKILICAAHLSHLKGQKYLIESLKNLPKNFVCFFIGEGEDRKVLETMTANFQLKSEVFFTGFQGDIRPYLAAADISVLPTLWEGLGSILLESALSGCCLIASDVGGIPEIITQNVTGVLVPPQNSLALQDAIQDLFSQPDKMRKLATAAKNFVAEKFNFEEVALKTELLYNGLLT